MEKNKGKIIITVENAYDKLNSSLIRRGIAKEPGIALTTLLIHFVSMAIEEGRDPRVLMDERLEQTIDMVRHARKN